MLLLVSAGLAGACDHRIIFYPSLTPNPNQVAGFLWSVFYARYPFIGVLRTMLSMVFIDFALVGSLIATVLW